MTQFESPLLSAWGRGEATIGLWGTLGGAFVAELEAAQGYDYVTIDLQHGVIDDHQLAPMIAGVDGRGVAPVVRTVGKEPWMVMRALDLGAHGVVVPMVDDADEARIAVEACRYPPNGVRSMGPARAAIAHGTKDARELERVACILMLETAGGLENVEAIAATPGIDVIYVGPTDLALALGIPPAEAAGVAAHEDAIQHVLAACQLHGVTAGIQCPDGASARRRVEQGFQMVSAGNDAALLQRVLSTELATAHSRS